MAGLKPGATADPVGLGFSRDKRDARINSKSIHSKSAKSV